MPVEALHLARGQFAMTAIFHILWPILTISLSAFLLVVETLWVRTNEVVWYRHARFWSKLLVLNFAVGVVSGIPMEFQFGTNWGAFSNYTGEFFGNILGFEGAMAFMLEAGFVGIMMLGWERVPKGVHLFATSMVALGSTLSAFWIMVANSWMQTPAGVEVVNGKLVVTDYAKAIFSPDMAWGVSHMWFAALETGLVVIAGISAYNLLRRRNPEFFVRSFKVALVLLAFIAPVQFWLGDSSGVDVLQRSRPKAQLSKATGRLMRRVPVHPGPCSHGPTKPGKPMTGLSKSLDSSVSWARTRCTARSRASLTSPLSTSPPCCPCFITRSASWQESASSSWFWRSGQSSPCARHVVASTRCYPNANCCWHGFSPFRCRISLLNAAGSSAKSVVNRGSSTVSFARIRLHPTYRQQQSPEA
jgi:hypothetical protein